MIRLGPEHPRVPILSVYNPWRLAIASQMQIFAADLKHWNFDARRP
jgi:hypothetical protein